MGDRAFGIFGCSVDNGRRTTVEIKMTLADNIDFNPRLKFIKTNYIIITVILNCEIII